MNGIRTKGSTLVYGDFGLKAESPGWVTAREMKLLDVLLPVT